MFASRYNGVVGADGVVFINDSPDVELCRKQQILWPTARLDDDGVSRR